MGFDQPGLLVLLGKNGATHSVPSFPLSKGLVLERYKQGLLCSPFECKLDLVLVPVKELPHIYIRIHTRTRVSYVMMQGFRLLKHSSEEY